MKRETRRGRTAQAARWLALRFPMPNGERVRIRWVEHLPLFPSDRVGATRRELSAGMFGYARGFSITLSNSACSTISSSVETLFHEWAHVFTTRDHDDAYWRCYGRIYREWYDDGGWLDSKEL